MNVAQEIPRTKGKQGPGDNPRPFGASFANWLDADKAKGGLGYRFGSVALVLAVAIVLMVATTTKE